MTILVQMHIFRDKMQKPKAILAQTDWDSDRLFQSRMEFNDKNTLNR